MTVFRQKDRDGNEYGNYRAWIPKIKRTVNLETLDRATAQAKAESLNSQSSIFVKSAPIVEKTFMTQPMMSGPPSGGIDAARLVSDWISSVPGNDTVPIKPNEGDTSNSPGVGEPAREPSFTGDAISVPPKKKNGLTPEQAAKIGTGLKKILCKVNMVAGAAAVQMFGRDPAPLEDDEIEMLVLGWEMVLEEYFQKAKPKAWMVLLVGNMMMGMAMYLRGEPTIKIEEEQRSPADVKRPS